MQALSQLSYGPWAAKFSGELVVLSPADPASLIVFRPRESELDLDATRKVLERQVVAPIEFGTVCDKCIDLVRRVRTPNEPPCRPTRRIAANRNDVADSVRPLALNPKQPAVDVENEVVAKPIVNGLQDTHSELDGLVDDRCLSNRALLIASEHAAILVCTSNNNHPSRHASEGSGRRRARRPRRRARPRARRSTDPRAGSTRAPPG